MCRSPSLRVNLDSGIYRVILKANKILAYKKVRGFCETAQNCSRKPLDEFT